MRHHSAKTLTPLSFDSLGDEAEDVLQELLERHPELLAGSDMRPGSPRRFILVRRETPIPDRLAGAGRWSIDHLFLDQDAIPALVEVKRSSDTRIRREVVGQMLDYAANGVQYWGVDQLRQMFETTWKPIKQAGQPGDDDKPSTPVEALTRFLGDDPETASVDEFSRRAEDNLRSGQLRLVFVADVIPQELRAIIEFLNERMPNVEVFGVEIRRYNEGGGYECYVPRLIGATAVAAQAKRRPTIPIEGFLDLCEASVRPEAEIVLAGWTKLGGKITATDKQMNLFLANPLKGGGDTCVLTVGSHGEVSINRGYILVAQRAEELASQTARLGSQQVAVLDHLIDQAFPGVTSGGKGYYLRAASLSGEAILDFGRHLADWLSAVPLGGTPRTSWAGS
jgi:hypothetical protein